MISTVAPPRRFGPWTRACALLGAALLLKGVVWAIVIPPMDGPDEATHMNYAQLVGLEGRLPAHRPGTGNLSPNVNALMGAVMDQSGPVPSATFFAPRHPLAASQQQAAQVARMPTTPDETSLIQEYGPVSYAVTGLAIRAVASSGVEMQLFAARLVVVVVGALGGLASVWVARECGLRRGPALAVGCIVGFEPMWSQQTAVLTADAFMLTFSTLFLALLLNWIRTRREAVLLGAAAALILGLFSKSAMAFGLPFAALVLLRVLAPRLSPGQRARQALVAIAYLGVMVVPFAIWYRARQGVILNGVINHAPARVYFHRLLLDRAAYPVSVLHAVWGNFGWVELSLPQAWLRLIDVVVVTGLLTAPLALYRRVLRARPTAILVVWISSVLAVALVFDYLFWRAHGGFASQGRYYLPALPALAVLLVGGLSSVVPRRAAWVMAPALAAATIILNIGAVEFVWSRFYAV